MALVSLLKSGMDAGIGTPWMALVSLLSASSGEMEFAQGKLLC
jgi:hypothetical protein